MCVQAYEKSVNELISKLKSAENERELLKLELQSRLVCSACLTAFHSFSRYQRSAACSNHPSLNCELLQVKATVVSFGTVSVIRCPLVALWHICDSGIIYYY